MASNALPVSRLINVSVNLTPAGAQAQNLSTLLIAGSTDVIDTVERIRSYSSLDAVALDFGTTSPEYLAALLWFQQTPQPTTLQIARWAETATKGGLRCAPLPSAGQSIATWNAVTTGAFTVTLNGGAPVTVSALDFSAAANLNAVAAIIDAALAGGTCVWNSVFQRFEFKSDATGATSSVSFLSTPGSGTDISGMLAGRSTDSGAYLFTGIVAESPVQLATLLDSQFGQSWYALMFADTTVTDDQHLAVAAFLEATNTKHFYGITSQAAGILVAATTSDLASRLKALAYKKTMVQYSSSNPYAVASALARILTTDYTGNSTVITLMYKTEPGIVAESLNSTQVDALTEKNANVFVSYNNDTAILQRGVTPSGIFVDTVLGTDWLAVTLQNSLYNLLYTSPTKIPQTDAGTTLLLATCEAVCAQAVINGLLAPGVWNSAGFGLIKQGDYLAKGYYLYAPRVDAQNPADRAARKSVPIQIAAKLAGAVHEVSVGVVVNQ